MEKRGEVILYQPDNEIKLEVRLEDETVWLNRQQLSALFNRDVKTIGKHINNALKEELAGLARGRPKRDFGRSLFFIIDKDVHITYCRSRRSPERMVY